MGRINAAQAQWGLLVYECLKATGARARISARFCSVLFCSCAIRITHFKCARARSLIVIVRRRDETWCSACRCRVLTRTRCQPTPAWLFTDTPVHSLSTHSTLSRRSDPIRTRAPHPVLGAHCSEAAGGSGAFGSAHWPAPRLSLCLQVHLEIRDATGAEGSPVLSSPLSL